MYIRGTLKYVSLIFLLNKRPCGDEIVKGALKNTISVYYSSMMPVAIKVAIKVTVS